MKPLRILLLAHNVKDSGTYNRFSGFARHLAAQGHEVTLVAATARRRLLPQIKNLEGARLVLTPTWLHPRASNGGLAPEDILARLAFVFDRPYDIVHASEHRPAASLPALLLRRLHKTVLISDWADLWGHEGIMDARSSWARTLFADLETNLETGFHQSANALTVICHDLYERARRLGTAPDHILNITNGVDIQECCPVANRADVRRKLGLPATGDLLVYAGQAPVDMDLLWSSFLEIYKSRPDVQLVVLGHKWPLPAQLGAAAHQIIQLGQQLWADYYLALACADVLLLPCRDTSRNRARWPGKLGFYMGVGRPIVANPTGDIGPLFKQHSIGVLAGEDPVEFAKAALNLLENPDLADALGHNGRDLAQTQYAWPLIASQLASFYQRIFETCKTSA